MSLVAPLEHVQQPRAVLRVRVVGPVHERGRVGHVEELPLHGVRWRERAAVGGRQAGEVDADVEGLGELGP